MSFQKVVTIQNYATAFTLDDDENIHIRSDAAELTVTLDMFMTTTEREKILTNMASSSFMSIAAFWGLFDATQDNSISERFTYESFYFMKYLMEMGLPGEIAAQTAFLTDFNGSVTNKDRQENFERFRSDLHALKLAQSGKFLGLTTFIPFSLIAQHSGLTLASRASRRVDDDPELLFALADGILKFPGGEIDAEVSDVEFNILMDFMADSVPNPRAADAEKFAKFLVELVLSGVSWNQVAKYLNKDKNFFDDSMNVKIVEFIRSTITTGYFPRESAPASVRNITAIVRSRFGDENLGKAFEVLELNREILSYGNGEHFIAWVTIADYMKSGGAVDEPITWMIAMEPMLNEKNFIRRVYGALDE